MNHNVRKVMWKLEVAENFQKMLAADGMIPDSEELLLKKYRVQLQYAGGIVIGFFISVTSLLLVFIIFNMLLHFSI